jgi:hypothetical protein
LSLSELSNEIKPQNGPKSIGISGKLSIYQISSIKVHMKPYFHQLSPIEVIAKPYFHQINSIQIFKKIHIPSNNLN